MQRPESCPCPGGRSGATGGDKPDNNADCVACLQAEHRLALAGFKELREPTHGNVSSLFKNQLLSLRGGTFSTVLFLAAVSVLHVQSGCSIKKCVE